MGLASVSGSRVLLAVCLFDGLCERLMGLSSVSGSRILLAVFVYVSFSGCLCVCHSRCGCVVCVLCCVWVFRVCVLPLRAPWQLGRLGSSADVGTATQLPKPRKEAGTPAKQCAPSLPDGAAAAQTMQPRLLHRPCSPGAAPKCRTACTMAPSRPLLAERARGGRVFVLAFRSIVHGSPIHRLLERFALNRGLPKEKAR